MVVVEVEVDVEVEVEVDVDVVVSVGVVVVVPVGVVVVVLVGVPGSVGVVDGRRAGGAGGGPTKGPFGMGWTTGNVGQVGSDSTPLAYEVAHASTVAT